jgi:heme exporter protein D
MITSGGGNLWETRTKSQINLICFIRFTVKINFTLPIIMNLLTNILEVKQTNNTSLQKQQREQRTKLAQGFDLGGETTIEILKNCKTLP